MAKLISNPAIGELTGTIGDLVLARYKTGKVVVRHRPVRTAEIKQGEVGNQQQFACAVIYAKGVWATQPDLQAKYKAAAREQGRQGFHLAKADFRLPPKVQDITLGGYTGNPGEIIRMTATDDFEVKEVGVVIRDLTGGLIEQGAAVQENGTWAYRAQTQVPTGRTVVIEATATDHPGHTGSKRVDHACGPRPS
jgi:hypothetical protein